MSLSFNGTETDFVKFNNNDVENIKFNGTDIWSKSKIIDIIDNNINIYNTNQVLYNTDNYLIMSEKNDISTAQPNIDKVVIFDKNTKTFTTKTPTEFNYHPHADYNAKYNIDNYRIVFYPTTNTTPKTFTFEIYSLNESTLTEELYDTITDNIPNDSSIPVGQGSPCALLYINNKPYLFIQLFKSSDPDVSNYKKIYDIFNKQLSNVAYTSTGVISPTYLYLPNSPTKNLPNIIFGTHDTTLNKINCYFQLNPLSSLTNKYLIDLTFDIINNAVNFNISAINNVIGYENASGGLINIDNVVYNNLKYDNNIVYGYTATKNNGVITINKKKIAEYTNLSSYNNFNDQMVGIIADSNNHFIIPK